MQMLRLLVALSALQLAAEEFLRQAETRQRLTCAGLAGAWVETLQNEGSSGKSIRTHANIDMKRII